MRRPSARVLIIVPWIAITLASVFLFVGAAPEITDQTIAVAILAIAISIPTAYFVADYIVVALHDLRAESSRLARLRSSSVSPYTIDEIHALRVAITTATDELHARANEAELNTARLRAVLESLTEGVIQLSAQGRFIAANAAAREMLHLPIKVEGQSISALVRNAELRTLLQNAAAAHAMESTEITFDDRQLLISPRRLRFASGGEIPGIVVGIVDLTQLRRLETVRRDFVANVSHEFKTPLTSIRGYAETLINDELTRQQQEEFLEVIRKNAERLRRLVDDLLDLSRLQSGGWQPQPTEVDVAAVAHEVWSSLAVAIDFNVITHGSAVVIADPSAIRQVISNILENAIRHTPADGSITVEINALNGRMTEIQVRDTGTGISRDALPRIFERFYRSDSARARSDGGTGLGLSIVKHLVEQMNGEVTAESEFGRGATIRVMLPTAL